MKRDSARWLTGKRMGGEGGTGNAGKEKEGVGEQMRWEGSVRVRLGMEGKKRKIWKKVEGGY